MGQEPGWPAGSGRRWRGEHGQLGHGAHGEGIRSWTPTAVAGPLARVRVVALAAGYEFTLALSSSGHVWAWGQNDCGQLGLGDTQNRDVPMCVGALAEERGGERVVEIAAGH